MCVAIHFSRLAKEKIMADIEEKEFATSEEIANLSKSELIRRYLSSVGPKERGPKAVSEALKAKGILVTTGLVSAVKATSKTKRKKPLSKKDTSANKDQNIQSWMIAKNLLNSVGGDLTIAKKNLEIVAKILNS